jgi:hypothetical protein
LTKRWRNLWMASSWTWCLARIRGSLIKFQMLETFAYMEVQNLTCMEVRESRSSLDFDKKPPEWLSAAVRLWRNACQTSKTRSQVFSFARVGGGGLTRILLLRGVFRDWLKDPSLTRHGLLHWDRLLHFAP